MRYRKSKLCQMLIWMVLMGLLTGCAPKRVTKETQELTFGIDVARYQGTIQWQQVAASGVDFAMVRLGYRTMSDGVIREDNNGRYNLQEAAKAGIPVGAYFFSSAITVEEAEEEARWTAAILDQYPITYPVAYDCEGYDDPESRHYFLTKQERTDIALAFLKTIEQLGYEGMFYASRNHLVDDLKWETSRISQDYKIWVAQYPELPYPQTEASSYPEIHHMWQYSMDGSVPGIQQPVDLNVCYFGYDGIEPPKNPEPPEEVEPDVEALMNFTQVDEPVTAKEETNLRSVPSQGEDSQVLYTLKNGEIAQRIAVSANGWSKVIFQGQTYYAVTSYLTTDLSGDSGQGAPAPTEDDGIETEFTPVEESVTAKNYVNLRALPSVEDEEAEVLFQLHNGDVAKRTGVSDNGWSRLVYQDRVCYAVTQYLIKVEQTQQPEAAPAATAAEEPYEVQTQFEPANDRMTAKLEVNLRTLPSVEHPDSEVVYTIKNGDVVTRTGLNTDVGWSRVEYNGKVLYCVSSYLTPAQP